MNSIKNFIGSFFDTSYYKDEKTEKEDEKTWVNRKLEHWKIDIYSENKYLNDIPISRIIKKKEELKKEYNSKT